MDIKSRRAAERAVRALVELFGCGDDYIGEVIVLERFPLLSRAAGLIEPGDPAAYVRVAIARGRGGTLS